MRKPWLTLSRVVPPIHQFRVRSRVFPWYGRLREIENENENDLESGKILPQDLLVALDSLEAHVGSNHIHLVCKKLLHTR